MDAASAAPPDRAQGPAILARGLGGSAVRRGRAMDQGSTSTAVARGRDRGAAEGGCARSHCSARTPAAPTPIQPGSQLAFSRDVSSSKGSPIGSAQSSRGASSPAGIPPRWHAGHLRDSWSIQDARPVRERRASGFFSSPSSTSMSRRLRRWDSRIPATTRPHSLDRPMACSRSRTHPRRRPAST